MNKLKLQVEKARNSKFQLWLLNIGLLNTVPFNKPHRLKITHINNKGITICAKTIKSNRNHIHGIHACLLATLCEYVSGFSLLIQLDPKHYRIILKNINMTYHYQAKEDVYVTFLLTKEEVDTAILTPLLGQEAIFKEFTVEVWDRNQHHICSGKINWQIKKWSDVKTK